MNFVLVEFVYKLSECGPVWACTWYSNTSSPLHASTFLTSLSGDCREMHDLAKRIALLRFQHPRTHRRRHQVTFVGVSDWVSAWRRAGVPAASQAQASRHDPDVPDIWHRGIHRAHTVAYVRRGGGLWYSLPLLFQQLFQLHCLSDL